jgi:hypothetical protein
MATLRYDGALVEFDDRLMTHLQIVILQKLRQGESFAMSWLDALSSGDGRSSIWLFPSMPLYFKFAGSKVPTISREWLDRLGESAARSSGLIVVNEDGSHARSQHAYHNSG